MTRSSFPDPRPAFRNELSRRDWLRLAAAGVLGPSVSGWLGTLAAATAGDPKRKRSCVLLWMSGGPSQMDTFDLKPGTANGGPYKEIATSVPGLRISEHLPKIAEFGDKLAVVRSIQSREGDHGRATYYLRTGYRPQEPIRFPGLGSLLAKELVRDDSPLPPCVSIAPGQSFAPRAIGAGFLGPLYAPLVVGEPDYRMPQDENAYERSLKVENLKPATDVTAEQFDARLDLLAEMEKEFGAGRRGASARGHRAAYDRAVRLMKTSAARAFELERESKATRDAYGRNLFGQGCLLARRLIEHGVPFVEVTLPGWDTHGQNFTAVQRLSGILDPAWGALMRDLKERGLLDTTLIVWMGEFGRTPKINQANGRDHFPNAWSAVLAGGGIKGGQAVGKTSKDGMTVADRPVSVPDLLATVCRALGVDPDKQNPSDQGRPIRIVDKGRPITEIVG
jgi:hypothetical protein